MDDNIKDLINKLREFNKERDWDQFHTPKNLIISLFKEIGELSEIFQWKNIEDSKLENLSNEEIEKIKDELSDILIYLIRISDVLKIDIMSSTFNKIEKNKIKYPISKSYGSSKKYDQF